MNSPLKPRTLRLSCAARARSPPAAAAAATTSVPTDAVAVVGDSDDHASSVRRADRAGGAELQGAEARRSRRPARPSTRSSRTRRWRTSSSAPSSSRRPRTSDIEVTDEEVDKRLDADQEAVLRRRREAVPSSSSRQQGLTEEQVRDDIRAQLISRRSSTRRSRRHQGHRRGDPGVLRREQGAVRAGRESRDVRHILVKKKALRPTALRPAQGRRGLRQAREEVLAGPGLEEPGRQADGLEGPDRAAVRQGRVRARRRASLAAGQDAVRLAHHPAALGIKPAQDDAARQGRRTRSSSSSCSRRRTRR